MEPSAELPSGQDDQRAAHRPRRWLAAAAVALVLGAGAGGYVAATANESASPPATASTTNTPTSVDQVAAQADRAIVDVTSKLAGGSTAKGTGLVIASNGIVLTNNHVVDGATEISVQLVTTGRTYDATLIGYSTSSDVAVLRLSNASGLATISASESSATAGESVVVIGNAGGRDGTPSAVAGSVTAVGQTITASDNSGADAETLHGLVEVSADIEAGDSGGAVVDSSGNVVAMTTAASDAPIGTTSATTIGYAIPIQTALATAHQIESGADNSNVHNGMRGVLGVEVEDTSAGLTIVAVQSGSAAAQAGLASGDVIVAVNGQTTTSSGDLERIMDATHVGDRVQITWFDSSGVSHTATITLNNGVA